MPVGPPNDQALLKNDKPVEKDTDIKADAPKPAHPAAAATKKAPPPPVDSKPDVAAALAPPAPAEPKSFAAAAAAASQPKARAPALPRQPAASKVPVAVGASTKTNQTPAELAAAAVAAAMAKLPGVSAKPPQVPTHQKAAGDNLAQKLNEMRIDDQSRHHGQSLRGHSRGRGRGRGAPRGVVIPNTDFDFESSNKKFNKEELAKEAEPFTEGTTGDADDEANGDDEVVIPAAPNAYDKKKSFFDNISSELKDRDEKRSAGGHEFKTEERKKNIETFGQGSVDGYRGGYRGRGRGGRGGRGRGGGGYGMNRGRGGFRGFGGAGGNQAFA
jgi:protein LSM14